MGLIDRLFPVSYAKVQAAEEALDRAVGDSVQNLVPPRATGGGFAGAVNVTDEMARKSSAKWAAIRLRADLVSTMPLEVKRKNPDGSVSIVDSKGLQLDGIGGPLPLEEWLYSSQSDLDETGNTIGIVEERDPFSGRPTWIRLVPSKSVAIRARDGLITYHIGSKAYDPFEVWHERQYTVPGSPVGLSPLAYATLSLGQNLSALQFGLQFFETAGLPTVQVKNNTQQMTPEAAAIIKARYEATMRERGVLVTGKDWDIDIQAINADESQFLQTLDASNADIARFFGVPGDVIDVNSSGSSVTYANITQRFLSLLVLHMQPALVRRERKFSRDLLPNKVFAKFRTSDLLRLDPTADAALQTSLVKAKVLSPDEARGHYELPPLTAEQIALIHDLAEKPAAAPPVSLPDDTIPAPTGGA